jgi:hypothetical protein
MKLTSFEHRWVRATLEGFAPASSSCSPNSCSPDANSVEAGLVPREGEVDWSAAFLAIGRASNPRARLGLRFALWMVALSPLWFVFLPRAPGSPPPRAATLAGVPVGMRGAYLEALLSSEIFVVRELSTLIKVAAAFAFLGTPSVRARSGYDRGLPVRPSSPREVLHVVAGTSSSEEHDRARTPSDAIEAARSGAPSGVHARRGLPVLRPSGAERVRGRWSRTGVG